MTIWSQNFDCASYLKSLEGFDKRRSADSLLSFLELNSSLQELCTSDSLIGESFRLKANALLRIDILPEALSNYHQALQYFKRHFKNNKAYRLNTIYTNLAIVHYKQSNYDSSEYYCTKAIEPPGDTDAIQNRITVLLSSIYDEKKEFYKAVRLKKQQIDKVTSNPDYENWELAEAQMMLAGSYFDNRYYEDAKKYYLLAIENFKKIDDPYQSDQINLANSYELLAQTFEIKENYDGARVHYNSAIELYDMIYSKDHIQHIRLKNSLAILMEKENKLPESNKLLEDLISDSHRIGRREYLVNLYTNLSKNYARLNRFDKSNIALDSANYYHNKIYHRKSFQNKLYLLTVQGFNFLEKIKAKEIDITNYQTEYSQLLSELKILTSRVRHRLSNSETQIALQHSIKPIFEYLIEGLSLLQKKKSAYAINKLAFEQIEASKSYLLESRLLQRKNLDNHPKLIGQMDSLETQIQENREKLVLQKNINTDSINQAIIDQVSSLDELTEKYFQGFQEDVNLNNTMTTLNRNELALNYFYGDTSIYLSVIGHDFQQLFQLDETQNFTHKAKTFLESLTERKSIDHNFTKELIPFEIPTSIERLIIIPDGLIANIPFEALKQSNKYLLEDYIISYDHSYSYHVLNSSKSKSKNKEIHGFAPGFGKDKTVYTRKEIVLPTLNYNILEIQQILGLGVDIKNHIEGQATREKFMSVLDKSYILHLSTHGILDDSLNNYSFLAFAQRESDDKKKEKSILYLDELYTKNIDAEMVVLSACNTGIGEIKNGEGVMSMGRGFSYAGARSIIMSLWEVNDKSTSELMLTFYKYLQEGRQKDEALRMAKLQYLENNFGLDAHPYFWASFVAMGDMRPVLLDFNVWKFIGPMIVMLIIFIFFRKRMFNDGKS